MGNSQSNSNRNNRINSALQSKKQTKSPSHADSLSQSLPFLQVDPNPNPLHSQAIRRRHSSIGNPSSRPRPIRHQRSASSGLFSRLSLGCASADISILSRESDSDASDLFDSHVDDDKARFVHLSRYSDEPPTSPSTTTFSKNSQPTSLPCLPPSHLAYYSPPISDGRKASLDSAAEAAFDIFLKQYPRTHHLSSILNLV